MGGVLMGRVDGTVDAAVQRIPHKNHGVTWTTGDIPDLDGRTAIVTGSNTGIGLQTAAALADNGATVVLACRDLARAENARSTILTGRPAGSVELLRLDLSHQGQIAEAAAEATERFERIDILINNAGVLGVPHQLTGDGFELVFGTNHLGHFAFTGRLLPTLLATPGSRVVTVSSLSHRWSVIPWNDLTGERRYSKTRAYGHSKLANLLFSFELQRRLARAAATMSSLAAHPGTAASDIFRSMVENHPRSFGFGARFIPTPADAARSSLRAATDPGAYGGQFYGPSGFAGLAGPPIATSPARRATREADQARLWDISTELTGVKYPL